MRTVSRGRSPGGMQKGGAGAVNVAAEARDGHRKRVTRLWKGGDGAQPTPMPHDSSAREQYTPVLALRRQSGDRETAVAAQGTQSEAQEPLRVGRLPRSAEGVG